MKNGESSRLANAIGENSNRIIEGWFNNQFSSQFISEWKLIDSKQVNKDQLLISYYGPLIRLLQEYLKTDNSAYLYGYLDERLRYSPHREAPEIREKFFKTLIGKDAQTLIDVCASESVPKDTIERLFSDIHLPLTDISHKNNLCMLALGDCLMNEVRVFLPHLCNTKKINLDMRCIYFSAHMGKGIDLTEITNFINHNKVDFIAISALSYEALPLYSMLLKECDSLTRQDINNKVDNIINLIANMLKEIRSQTEATILFHNSSGLPLGRYRKRLPILPVFSSAKKYTINQINTHILNLTESISNVILIDEYKIAKEFGIRKCTKEIFKKSVIRDGMLHTGNLGYFLCNPYLYNISAYNALHKCKVVMVDFDNTLWSGVMADGDVQHYDERQHILKTLKDAGILLVSISKNTEENIRWDEIKLSKNDFVLHKINWDLKVKSISDAVKELNIGIDTVVFIDDNPVELDLVKQEIPDLIVLDANDSNTWDNLNLMAKFPNTKETEESKKRTEMYQQAFERNASLQNKEYDYPKMMASLELKSTFKKASNSDLDRIFELVNRTNQFNTTTIRYSKEEIKEMMYGDKFLIYTATLSDKFGELGVVLVVILELKEDAAIINSFIMSCRAMGFALEKQILALLIDKKLHGKDRLIGIYRQTDRNTPCSGLYEINHFAKLNEEEWLLDINQDSKPEKIDWITMC